MNGSGTSRNIHASPSVATYSAMRSCTGGCGKRKSIGQFLGASTVCIRCARRAT